MQAAKKPKGTGQDTEQGQGKEVSKSGGGRVVKEKLSKSGRSRDKGKDIDGRPSKNRGMQEGEMVNQRRGHVYRIYLRWSGAQDMKGLQGST